MLKIQFYFDYASCWTIYPSSVKSLNSLLLWKIVNNGERVWFYRAILSYYFLRIHQSFLYPRKENQCSKQNQEKLSEINIQTKHTKNRARVKYQSFPLRAPSKIFEGTSQKQIKLFVKMYWSSSIFAIKK